MPRKKAAKFKCGKCGKVFTMAMHLGRHMTTIHGKPPKQAASSITPRKAPRAAATGALISMIQKLRSERQTHLDAIAEIDSLFAQCGIQPATLSSAGAPRKAEAARKPAARKAGRKRRKFTTSGNESILAFLKKSGPKGATGAEIAKHWKAEGRGAGVYVNLSQFVKAKKLKREKMKGGKGSRYSAA